MLSSSTVIFDGLHVARSRCSAAAAPSGVSCSTPMKSPSRTTSTPGRASAALVSTDSSSESWAGGRTTRAYSMPGRRTSPAKTASPVTLARDSTCRWSRPTVS